jgi:hypothetical protein
MLHILLHYLRDRLLGEWMMLVVFPSFIAIWFFLKRIPSWLRAVAGRNWPTVQGRIETVTVKTVGDQSLAELGYSYAVQGSRYSGYLSLQFSDEQIAWDFATGLEDRCVIIRYRTTDPEVSAIRAADQPADFNFKGDSFWVNLWRRFYDGISGSAYPRRL